MTWRYQPVWTGGPENDAFSLTEVYLDAEGRLVNWTQSEAITPIGNSALDLIGELSNMLDDARRWKPVAFASLKAGMVFERVEG